MLPLPAAVVGRSAGQAKTEAVPQLTSKPVQPVIQPAYAEKKSTIEYKYQLAGHTLPVLIYTYNTRRHHVLTCDAETMRLWSLRKELKKVMLPKEGKNPLVHSALVYNETRDVYIGLTGGDPAMPEDWTYPSVIRIYHPSLLVILQFSAHQSTILTGVFNNDRQELVSSGGGFDSVLRVWKVSAPSIQDNAGVFMEERGTLSHHDTAIDTMHIHGDLLFGSAGAYVWMWDQGSMELLRHIELGERFVSCLCYSAVDNNLYTGTDAGDVIVWNMDSEVPTELVSAKPHNESPLASIWFEEGSGVFSCASDGTVYHFRQGELNSDSQIGEYKFELKVPGNYQYGDKKMLPVPRALWVSHIDVPSCRKELLFVISGGLITLFEVMTDQKPLGEVQDMVIAMTTSVNAESGASEIVVLAQNNTLSVLDTKTGATRRSIEPPARRIVGALQRTDVNRMQRRGIPGTQLPHGHRAVFSQRKVGTAGHRSAELGSMGKGLQKPSMPLPDPTHASAEMTSFECVDELGCYLLGWSYGALELVNMQTGVQEMLFENPSVDSPVSAICQVTTAAGRQAHSLHKSTASGAAQYVHAAALPHFEKQQEYGGNQRTRANSVQHNALRRAEIIGHGHVGSRVPPTKQIMAGGGGQQDQQNQESRMARARGAHFLGDVQLEEDLVLAQRLKAGIEPPLLIAGSAEGMLYVWDVLRPTGKKLVAAVRGHSDFIVSVLLIEGSGLARRRNDGTAATIGAGDMDGMLGEDMLAPDTDVVLSVSADGMMKVWTTPPLHLLGFCHCTAEPAVGVTLASKIASVHAPAGLGVVIVGYDNGVMQVWQLPWSDQSQSLATEAMCTVQQHASRVSKIGTLAQPNRLFSCSHDHQISIWALEPDGQAGFQLTLAHSFAFPHPVTDCLYDCKKRRLVIACEDRLCEVNVKHFDGAFADGTEEPENEFEEMLQQKKQISFGVSDMKSAPSSPSTSSMMATPMSAHKKVRDPIDHTPLGPWDEAALARGGTPSLPGTADTEEPLLLPEVQPPSNLQLPDAVLEGEFHRHDRHEAGVVQATSLASILNVCTANFSMGDLAAAAAAGRSQPDAMRLAKLMKPTVNSRARDVIRPVCTELQMAQLLSQVGVGPNDVLSLANVRLLVGRYMATLAAAGFLPNPPRSSENRYRSMRPQKMVVSYNELGERRMRVFEDPNNRAGSDETFVKETVYKHHYKFNPEEPGVTVHPGDDGTRKMRFTKPPPLSHSMRERQLAREFRQPLGQHGDPRKWWHEDTSVMVAIPMPFRKHWSAGWEKALAASVAAHDGASEKKFEMVMGKMVEVEDDEEEHEEAKPPLHLRPLLAVLRKLWAIKIEQNQLADEHGEEHVHLATLVYQYFITKFGVKTAAEEKLMQLFHSLLEHQGCIAVRTFGRTVGIFPGHELDPDAVLITLRARTWLAAHDMIRKGGSIPGQGMKHDDELRWELVGRLHAKQCIIHVLNAEGGGISAPWLRQTMINNIDALFPSADRYEWEPEQFRGPIDLEYFISELVDSWAKSVKMAEDSLQILFPGMSSNPATFAFKTLLDAFLLEDPLRSGAMPQDKFVLTLLKFGPVIWQGNVPCNLPASVAAWHAPELMICSEVCDPHVAQLAIRFKDVTTDGLVCWLDLWALAYVELFEYGHILKFNELLDRSHEHRPGIETAQMTALKTYMQSVALSQIAPERKHHWWKKMEKVDGISQNIDLSTTVVAGGAALAARSRNGTSFFSVDDKPAHVSKSLHSESTVEQNQGVNGMCVFNPQAVEERKDVNKEKIKPQRLLRQPHKSVKHKQENAPMVGVGSVVFDASKIGGSTMTRDAAHLQPAVVGEKPNSLNQPTDGSKSLTMSQTHTAPHLQLGKAACDHAARGTKLLQLPGGVSKAADQGMIMPCHRAKLQGSDSKAARLAAFDCPEFVVHEKEGASLSLRNSRTLGSANFDDPWGQPTPFVGLAKLRADEQGTTVAGPPRSRGGRTTKAEVRAENDATRFVGTNTYIRFPDFEPFREQMPLKKLYQEVAIAMPAQVKLVRRASAGIGGDAGQYSAFEEMQGDSVFDDQSELQMGERLEPPASAVGRLRAPAPPSFDASADPTQAAAAAAAAGEGEVAEAEADGDAAGAAPDLSAFMPKGFQAIDLSGGGNMGAEAQEKAKAKKKEAEAKLAAEEAEKARVEAERQSEILAEMERKEEEERLAREAAKAAKEHEAIKKAIDRVVVFANEAAAFCAPLAEAALAAAEQARKDEEERLRREEEERLRREAEERAREACEEAIEMAQVAAEEAMDAAMEAEAAAIAADEKAKEDAEARRVAAAEAAADAAIVATHCCLPLQSMVDAAFEAYKVADAKARKEAAERAAAKAIAECVPVAYAACAEVGPMVEAAQDAYLAAKAEEERKEAEAAAKLAAKNAAAEAFKVCSAAIPHAWLEVEEAYMSIADEESSTLRRRENAIAVQKEADKKVAAKEAEEQARQEAEEMAKLRESLGIAGSDEEEDDEDGDFEEDMFGVEEGAEGDMASMPNQDKEALDRFKAAGFATENAASKAKSVQDKWLMANKVMQFAMRKPKVKYAEGLNLVNRANAGEQHATLSEEALSKYDKELEVPMDVLLQRAKEAKEAQTRFESSSEEEEGADDEEEGGEEVAEGADVVAQALPTRRASMGSPKKGKKEKKALEGFTEPIDLGFKKSKKLKRQRKKGEKKEYRHKVQTTFSQSLSFKPYKLRGGTQAPRWNEKDFAEEEVEDEDDDDDITTTAHQRHMVGQDLSFLYNTREQEMNKLKDLPKVQLQFELPWKDYFQIHEDDIVKENRSVTEQDSAAREERLRKDKARELEAAMHMSFKKKDGEENGAGNELQSAGSAQSAGSKWWRQERNSRRTKVASGEIEIDQLPFGVTVEGKTKEGGFKYFCVKVEDDASILTISLKNNEGDADLFVSTVTVPSVVDYDWKSYALGDDRVVIQPTDPRAKIGFYFIGIFAYEKPVDFCLCASLSGLDNEANDSMLHLNKLVNRFQRLGQQMQSAQKSGAPKLDFDAADATDDNEAEKEKIEAAEAQLDEEDAALRTAAEVRYRHQKEVDELRKQAESIRDERQQAKIEAEQEAKEAAAKTRTSAAVALDEAAQVMAGTDKSRLDESGSVATESAPPSTSAALAAAGGGFDADSDDGEQALTPAEADAEEFQLLAARVGSTVKELHPGLTVNEQIAAAEAGEEYSDTSSVRSSALDELIPPQTREDLCNDYSTWRDPSLGNRLAVGNWRGGYARVGQSGETITDSQIRTQELSDTRPHQYLMRQEEEEQVTVQQAGMDENGSTGRDRGRPMVQSMAQSMAQSMSMSTIYRDGATGAGGLKPAPLSTIQSVSHSVLPSTCGPPESMGQEGLSADESVGASTNPSVNLAQPSSVSQSMDTFLNAFKSPSLQQYKAMRIDHSYSSLVGASRRKKELDRVRSRAVQMQHDEVKSHKSGVESINTRPIEKVHVSRRKPRVGRPGLRSMNTEPVEPPREGKARAVEKAAAEVAEQTVKSRELAGWNVPVNRTNPLKKPPQKAIQINRQTAKKTKAFRARKKQQIDPKLQALLTTLENVPRD
jgi:WD40 repeat protein